MFFSDRFQNSSMSMPSASPDEMFWPMNVVGARPVARSIQSSGFGEPVGVGSSTRSPIRSRS